MSLTVQEPNQSATEHARWRLRFRQSLLDVHRATQQAGKEWRDKEEEYEREVKEAETELAALEGPHTTDTSRVLLAPQVSMLDRQHKTP